MAAVLNLVLKETVRPTDVVAWLTHSSSTNEEVNQPALNLLDNWVRPEVVPYFLNFLREQTLNLVQNGHPGGQTPIKVYPRPASQRKRIPPNRKPLPTSLATPRIQLFPSTSDVHSKSCSDSIERTENVHHPHHQHNSYTMQQSVTEKRSHHHSKYDTGNNNNILRSQQKFSLGQFIVQIGSANQRRKQLHAVNNNKNSNDSSLDINNVNHFPPVASGNFKKEKRRITPTPVCTTSDEDAVVPKSSSTSDSVGSGSSNNNNRFVSASVKRSFNTASPANNAFKAALEEEEIRPNDVFTKSRRSISCVETTNVSTQNLPCRSSVLAPTGLVKVGMGTQTNTTPLLIKKPVVTNPTHVTFKRQLDLLVELYCGCLAENLVPNLCVELYFLVQLLTAAGENESDDVTSVEHDIPFEQGSDNESLDIRNYFGTSHNCVHFVVNVLTKQLKLINLLDKQTQRLLCNCPNVKLFSNQLHKHLTRQLNKQSGIDTKVNSRSLALLSSSSPIGCVAFQSDTDNRNNFSNEHSFHMFRKQRDAFYEILRDWEANHRNPDWDVTQVLGHRISGLVTMWPDDPVVYSHFTRLFVLQLSVMCVDGDQEMQQLSNSNNSSVDHPDILKDLKTSNPGKFKRLQERFVTPSSMGGPSPAPSFPGAQEFFRMFILLARCPKLNQHLTDVLVSKVAELNEVELTLPDKDGNDVIGTISPPQQQHHSNTVSGEASASARLVDDVVSTVGCSDGTNGVGEITHRQFVSTLSKLRLFAKFLGFLVFHAYHVKNPQSLSVSVVPTAITVFPQSVLAEQTSIRNRTPLVVDLLTLLISAISRRRTLLTVPWVVEFLSMMDPVAPSLDSVKRTLVLLIRLYRSMNMKQAGEAGLSLNKFFLVLMIGWLFENPNFPPSLFFMEIPASSSHLDIPLVVNGQDNEMSIGAIDCLPLIDHDLLYSCCPYLAEVKVLLSEFTAGVRNPTGTVKTVKKITPIKATDDDCHNTVCHGSPTNLSSSKNSLKQLQVQLEANFFHNQPASLRKTVEFVAERIASNAIKRLRQKDVPRVQERIRREFNVFLTEKVAERQQLQQQPMDKNMSNIANKFMSELSVSACNEVGRRSTVLEDDNDLPVASVVDPGCSHERLRLVIVVLLPDETAATVVETCVHIAVRLSKENVAQWVSRYVIPAFFFDDLKLEYDKFRRRLMFSAPPTSTPTLKQEISPGEVLLTMPVSLPLSPLSLPPSAGSSLVTDAAASTPCELLPPNPPLTSPSSPSLPLSTSLTTTTPKPLKYASLSSTDVILRLKRCAKILYIDFNPLCLSELNESLRDVQEMLEPSQERIIVVAKCLGQLSMELLPALLAVQPEVIDDLLLSTFITIWRKSTSSNDGIDEPSQQSSTMLLPASVFICCRNLTLWNYSENTELTLTALEKLLDVFLKERLVTLSDLRTQFVELVSTFAEMSSDDRDATLLPRLAHHLENLRNKRGGVGGEENSFRHLLSSSTVSTDKN